MGFSQSLYDEYRIYANRSKRGLTPIDDLLRACWCRETARPDLQDAWSQHQQDAQNSLASRHRALGQDDVTALLMLLELRGGWLRIGQLNGRDYMYNREPNGEGYCDRHYAAYYPIDHRALLAARQLDRQEAEALLAADGDLRQRYELFVTKVRNYLRNRDSQNT